MFEQKIQNGGINVKPRYRYKVKNHRKQIQAETSNKNETKTEQKHPRDLCHKSRTKTELLPYSLEVVHQKTQAEKTR